MWSVHESPVPKSAPRAPRHRPATVRPDRREVLAWAAACALVGPRRTAPREEVEELLGWIVGASRDEALRRAARELRAGLDPSRLLGALLVAAAREIRTDVPQFNHSALSVSAIDQLTDGAPPDARRRDVLWCLDHFKEAQQRDARAADWRMASIATARLPEGERARRALVDALEAWDREAADVALTGWIRSRSLAEVGELVWEYGVRCQANAGHKAIYAALGWRALPLAGNAHAEDVLRSIVSSFFLHGRGEAAAAFEASRVLERTAIARRPVHPERSATDFGPGRALLAALRDEAVDLPAVTAELLADGAPPATLWDAVLSGAAEIAVASPGIGPLHAVTSVNALHWVARHAPSERLARLALLQAPAWLARFRGQLDQGERALRIEALEPVPATPASVLVDGPRGLAEARAALALGRDDLDGYLACALSATRAKADEVHQIKLAAAVLEEMRLAAEWVRPHLCAALAMHAPSKERADDDRMRRISEAVDAARGG
jgi:hypothetical protein